jgi:hypothetical protein
MGPKIDGAQVTFGDDEGTQTPTLDGLAACHSTYFDTVKDEPLLAMPLMSMLLLAGAWALLGTVIVKVHVGALLELPVEHV